MGLAVLEDITASTKKQLTSPYSSMSDAFAGVITDRLRSSVGMYQPFSLVYLTEEEKESGDLSPNTFKYDFYFQFSKSVQQSMISLIDRRSNYETTVIGKHTERLVERLVHERIESETRDYYTSASPRQASVQANPTVSARTSGQTNLTFNIQAADAVLRLNDAESRQANAERARENTITISSRNFSGIALTSTAKLLERGTVTARDLRERDTTPTRDESAPYRDTETPRGFTAPSDSTTARDMTIARESTTERDTTETEIRRIDEQIRTRGISRESAQLVLEYLESDSARESESIRESEYREYTERSEQTLRQLNTIEKLLSRTESEPTRTERAVTGGVMRPMVSRLPERGSMPERDVIEIRDRTVIVGTERNAVITRDSTTERDTTETEIRRIGEQIQTRGISRESARLVLKHLESDSARESEYREYTERSERTLRQLSAIERLLPGTTRELSSIARVPMGGAARPMVSRFPTRDSMTARDSEIESDAATERDTIETEVRRINERIRTRDVSGEYVRYALEHPESAEVGARENESEYREHTESSERTLRQLSAIERLLLRTERELSKTERGMVGGGALPTAGGLSERGTTALVDAVITRRENLAVTQSREYALTRRRFDELTQRESETSTTADITANDMLDRAVERLTSAPTSASRLGQRGEIDDTVDIRAENDRAYNGFIDNTNERRQRIPVETGITEELIHRVSDESETADELLRRIYEENRVSDETVRRISTENRATDELLRRISTENRITENFGKAQDWLNPEISETDTRHRANDTPDYEITDRFLAETAAYEPAERFFPETPDYETADRAVAPTRARTTERGTRQQEGAATEGVGRQSERVTDSRSRMAQVLNTMRTSSAAQASMPMLTMARTAVVRDDQALGMEAWRRGESRALSQGAGTGQGAALSQGMGQSAVPARGAVSSRDAELSGAYGQPTALTHPPTTPQDVENRRVEPNAANRNAESGITSRNGETSAANRMTVTRTPQSGNGYTESEYTQSLPSWARDFLSGSFVHRDVPAIRTETDGVLTASSAMMSENRMNTMPENRANTMTTTTTPPTAQSRAGGNTADTVWSAPGYAGTVRTQSPTEMAHKEKPEEQSQQQARFTNSEINRMADKVYGILSERIARERRRLGL